KEAKHITITDPYIRLFFQARNLMEFLEALVKGKAEEDEVVVSLITVEDEFKGDQQREFFEKIQNEMFTVGVKFDFSFDNSGSQHARHIVTDTGWKISLDRGLDIFQQYDMNDTFQLANRQQKQRSCKAFEVTYIRV
ncbi:MAG: ATP-dependent Lon protease, partial [Alphaproteobacteria bacterium]|nr:ATP-dependent Lon protease [Alphaproteobacteria bacterium]